MCVFLGIWYAHLIFVSRGKKYKSQVANDVLGKTSELSQSSLPLRSAVTILPGAEIRDGWSSPVVRRLGVCLSVQRMRVSSWFRKILQPVEQLSLSPRRLEPGSQSSHTVAGSSLCSLQLERACAQQQRSSAAVNTFLLKKRKKTEA